MKTIINNKGITIVELAISMALTMLLTASIYSVYMYATNSMVRSAVKYRDQLTATNAVNLVGRDLREVQGYSTFDPIPVAYADASDIVFYSDYDNDVAPEKLEYVLNNGTLYCKIIQPDNPNPPYTYNGSPVTKIIAKNITNTQIFSYYSGYDTALTNLPLSSTDRQALKLVKINISVDSNGSKEPPPTNVQTEIDLRNQNND